MMPVLEHRYLLVDLAHALLMRRTQIRDRQQGRVFSRQQIESFPVRRSDRSLTAPERASMPLETIPPAVMSTTGATMA